MAITIHDLHLMHGLREIQEVSKAILGESKENDEVIRLLAKVENLLVSSPEAIEEYEAMTA